jgi:uncharacterized protein
VKPYLLDVSLLVALAWSTHVHHRLATAWFRAKRQAGFRTCPITQAGLVRICSNPSFSSDAVSPAAALALLDRITSHPNHEFWPDDLPVRSALAFTNPSQSSHRQITARYLIGLAAQHDGIVATLDRGLVLFASGHEERVELVTAG